MKPEHRDFFFIAPSVGVVAAVAFTSVQGADVNWSRSEETTDIVAFKSCIEINPYSLRLLLFASLLPGCPDVGDSSGDGECGTKTKMHLEDFDSQYSPFLPSDVLSSPSDAAMAICCPSPLTSPHPFAPTPTAVTTVASGHIFQFPPPSSSTSIIKEEWQQHPSEASAQVSSSSALMHDLSSPGLCGPASSSSLPSPMAISPALSTLNTPRGSITDSIRHSPMNTDQTATAAPNSASSAVAGSTCSVVSAMREGTHSPAPSSPAFATATVDTTHALGCFDEYFASSSYPSPPGSRYSSPVHGQSSSSSSFPPHEPPTYEQHMIYHHQQQQQPQQPPFSSGASDSFSLSADLFALATGAKTEPDFIDAASPSLVQGGQAGGGGGGFLPSHVSSSTPDVLSDACPETPDSSVRDGGFEQQQQQPPISNSALLDTGKYICLWVDCSNEFETQRQLVEHVTEAHVESAKKGCEERPCLWKVS